MNERVLGAVLAGGQSRRMGRDKALLELENGKTLLGRAVQVLEAVLDDVVVVAPEGRDYRDLGVPLVTDLREGLGPLGGLHAALVHGAGRPVFVLACDLPRVPPDLVLWVLSSKASTDRDSPETTGALAWVVRDPHGPQPLCGLYSGACLPVVERALDLGRLSARDLLEDLGAETLELDSGDLWYEPGLLANANRPGDICEVLGQSEPES